MSERKLKNLVENTLEHIVVILERFASIAQADDFVKTPDGGILLDAILIRLQATGEDVKKLEKRNPEILHKHPQVDWNDIIRFRDLISHHYELLNHEIVFNICKVELPKLKEALTMELKLLSK